MFLIAILLSLGTYFVAYKMLFEDWRDFGSEMLWFLGEAVLAELFLGATYRTWWSWRGTVWVCSGVAVYGIFCWATSLAR